MRERNWYRKRVKIIILNSASNVVDSIRSTVRLIEDTQEILLTTTTKKEVTKYATKALLIFTLRTAERGITRILSTCIDEAVTVYFPIPIASSLPKCGRASLILFSTRDGAVAKALDE